MLNIKKSIFLTSISIVFSVKAQANEMSVMKVKEMLDNSREGETMAISYSQGVFDGLIAMEGARRNEGKGGDELCKLFEGDESIRHPAYQTEMLIETWERRDRNMEAPFADLALNYLSGQYGC